ncbi:uncharacterized protein LOC143465353 [Clavelina lepadiformis]|uniref:uncharacterized protein LOC143465353 n=1 Tax=Clavelina lepadiformis TaxID=159417 RepID=UPI004041E40E
MTSKYWTICSKYRTIVTIIFATAIISFSFGQEDNNNNDDSAVYKVLQSWNSAFQGEVNAKITHDTTYGWKFKFRYNQPLSRFECWVGEVRSSTVGGSWYEYTVVNHVYNKFKKAGTTFKLQFIGHYPEDVVDPQPPPVTVFFQGKIIFVSEKLRVTSSPKPSMISTTDFLFVLNSLTDPNRFISTRSAVATTTVSGGRDGSTENENEQDPQLIQEEINRRINEENDLRNNPERNRTVDESNEIEGSAFEPNNSTTATRAPTSLTIKSTISTSKRPLSTAPSTPITTRRPKPVPINVTSKFDYAAVLKKSIMFFEAQRSGKLPENNRLSWTRDSALQDKGPNGEDLRGGYYDAGDYVKFGFPMASSLTLLSWGVLEYWDAYEAVEELDNVIATVKWGTDYLLKAHVEPYVLYGQVGDAEIDHKTWGRPEDLKGGRPAFKITRRNPGSDLAGETSAALSAASLVFRRKRNGNGPYIRQLIEHASQLYTFARNFRQLYHISIPAAKKYYKSTNDKDEIAWAAAWLYRATGDKKFLDQAEGMQQNWGLFNLPTNLRFSWDDKRAGLQMLLSQISDRRKVLHTVPIEKYCNDLRSWRNYTTKGLLYLHGWSPLRYAGNSAFICLMAADIGIDTEINRSWSKNQIHYMLGDGGRSYVIGFGINYPKRPHHRASSCPTRPQRCDWQHFSTKANNPVILEGALVGGPDISDRYKDSRKDFKQSEVALDHNAGFQGSVAALQYRAMFPTAPIIRSDEPWATDTADDDGPGNMASKLYQLSICQCGLVATAVMIFNYLHKCYLLY